MQALVNFSLWKKSMTNIMCKWYSVRIHWLEISFFSPCFLFRFIYTYREFPTIKDRTHTVRHNRYYLDVRILLHLHISHFCFFGFRKFSKVSLVGAREQRAKINFTPGMGKWGKWIDKGVSPTLGWPPKRECDHGVREDRRGGGRKEGRKGEQNGNGVRRR